VILGESDLRRNCRAHGAASGIHATTSQVAALAALKALGVKRLAVASPFDDHQNDKLKQYLEGNGLG